ncbi:MAG: DUF4864 domain-containing protein [Hyphomicrobiales bacterium]
MYKSIVIAGMMAVIAGGSGPVYSSSNVVEIRQQNAQSPVSLGNSQSEISSIRMVVQSYLWALANQQSKLLYLTASTSVKSTYASPEALLAKMTQIHKPIVAGSLERFDGLRSQGSNKIQRVYIKDEYGRQWLASYLLEKDSTGNWKIAGCVILPAPGHVV